jgi:Fic family protein
MSRPLIREVSDAMSALFDLLETEEHALVRAVLGHRLFGFIHRYNDGNVTRW